MLRDLGVTHLALANNHAWDFGHVGVVETRRRAAKAGFAVAGAGATLNEAMAPAIHNGVALISVDAGPTPDWAIAGASPDVAALRMTCTLGLPRTDIARLQQIAEVTGEAPRRKRRAEVGYDSSDRSSDFYGLRMIEADQLAEVWEPDTQDMSRLGDCIEDTRKRASKILVALHYHNWASDWSRPPKWLLRAGKAIAAAGADAVLCTGPPFAYQIDRHNGSVVAPCLGNLVFHTRRGAVYDRLHLPVWQGMALVRSHDQWTTHTVNVLRPSPDTSRDQPAFRL